MTRLVTSAIIVALLQIGFLAWVIGARAAILRNGTEVLLKVEPIDPRDLLRGDYVRLGYAIATIPVSLLADVPPGMATTEAGAVTVRLAPGADGFWEPQAAFLKEPAAPAPEGQVDIVGRIGSGWSLASGSTLSVDYGIDRYYVPEGEGRAIEARLGQGAFSVLAAVGGDGTAQIKSLREGDHALYDEPLF